MSNSNGLISYDVRADMKPQLMQPRMTPSESKSEELAPKTQHSSAILNPPFPVSWDIRAGMKPQIMQPRQTTPTKGPLVVKTEESKVTVAAAISLDSKISVLPVRVKEERPSPVKDGRMSPISVQDPIQVVHLDLSLQFKVDPLLKIFVGFN